jgi:nuclear transport factor 2 (NTF2) superfamily protein
MTTKQCRERARAFLDAYRDPEIDKRLYFEVWADRKNLTDLEQHHVWMERVG